MKRRDGLTIGLKGHAGLGGSEHFKFHSVMDEFWDQFKRGGSREFQAPTCAEYDVALRQSLDAIGKFSKEQIDALATAAKIERKELGLTDHSIITKIPARVTPRN